MGVCLLPYRQRRQRMVPVGGVLVGAGGELSAVGSLDRYNRVPGFRQSGQVRSARDALLYLRNGVPVRDPAEAEPVPLHPYAVGGGAKGQPRHVGLAYGRAGAERVASELLA